MGGFAGLSLTTSTTSQPLHRFSGGLLDAITPTLACRVLASGDTQLLTVLYPIWENCDTTAPNLGQTHLHILALDVPVAYHFFSPVHQAVGELPLEPFFLDTWVYPRIDQGRFVVSWAPSQQITKRAPSCPILWRRSCHSAGLPSCLILEHS